MNFLDQGLDADYIARILAHVEDCYLCQQALERLTVGNSAIEDRFASVALPPEPVATIGRACTEILAQGDQPPSRNLNGVGPAAEQIDLCEPFSEMGDHTEPDRSSAGRPGRRGRLLRSTRNGCSRAGVYAGRSRD
jgi:hypothetical protein